MTPKRRLAILAFIIAGSAGLGSVTRPDEPERRQLPTGVVLDPEGRVTDVGTFPLAVLPSPEGDRIVLLLNGYLTQGVQVVSPASGSVIETDEQPAAFIGMSFDPTGHRLYASGGNEDRIYVYDWRAGSAVLADSIALATKPLKSAGTRYPAGIGVSPDGARLYVAENLADSLAVVDVATGHVSQRLSGGRYPYAVAVAQDGTVFVSAWGAAEVRVFRPNGSKLVPVAAVPVPRHPSALLLDHRAARLYVASASTDRVAVVDTKTLTVIAELADPVPGGTGEGSTPNALALAPDDTRLYVAEADNNAVAVFDVAAGSLLGRIPVGWYPTALLVLHDTLLVVNGKGRGAGPNGTDGPRPGGPPSPGYTLAQLKGTLSTIPLTGLVPERLVELSARVGRANHWAADTAQAAYPPFEHVIYVLKENRTYDQMLGDLPQGDGDTALVFFPRAVSPNHHALAERFGLFDRFLVNAEVSADGHNWSTAAYSTDYVEKTKQQNYSGRGRSYDYEGENRGRRPDPDDDAAEPANGYLWDLARRKGITFRNFGEFVTSEERAKLPPAYRGLKPFLASHTDSVFPGFDLDIPDQRRADIWLAELREWDRSGGMPALQILRLPNDHTAGAKGGAPTPRAFVADNDLALGRVIEALSKSRYWKNTVVFVLEDDAQSGADHVDSHRSPLLVISAYNRPGVRHRFTNTTDVLATIEEILSLDHLSQFDKFGRPLRGIFAPAPDLSVYGALVPDVALDERNPRTGLGARESRRLDLRVEDLADDGLFNRVLWRAIKGDRPYPGVRSLTAPLPVSRGR